MRSYRYLIVGGGLTCKGIREQRETLTEWEEPNRKGVVYCLDAERHPCGVLLWNVLGRVEAACDLIRAHQPIEAGTLSEPVG